MNAFSRRSIPLFSLLLLALPCGAFAGEDKPEARLTAAGEKLEARYAGMLRSLRTEVAKQLPAIEAAKVAALAEARSAWITLGQEADPNVRRAQEKAREEAEGKVLDAARAILADVDGLLASDPLDGKLMRIAVLNHGTPRGLAEFAQQGAAEESLLAKLLDNEPLMRQILEAGGANGGEYGEAMQVYQAILKASERARKPDTIFQRLALGTAIHTPWLPGMDRGGVYGIMHPTQMKHDPVKRYLHYEKAFLDGELDPAFPDMNVWQCRFITDDPYSDEDLAWVRQMVRTYRPDHVTNPDMKWRYVRIVTSDLPYISPTEDPSLGSPAQQHIALGGVCGRRAAYGRLASRAFGIPARASTQTGHGALSHWTPDGWTICFGGWWSIAWCGPQGGLDFLLDSQAREFPEEYRKVLRAQWIGDALGEEDVSIRRFGEGGGLWDGLAFWKKKFVVKQAEIQALELTGGMKAGESDELLGDETGEDIQIPETDRAIAVGNDGVIHVPAVACYSPRRPSDRILFLKSRDEGYQLHYNRLGQQPELMKYRIEVPAAGEYQLTAEVATVAPNQEILVRTNREDPAPFGLPYTKGMWMETGPIKVSLTEGRNMLTVTARAPNRGVSIKQWKLTPVK